MYIELTTEVFDELETQHPEALFWNEHTDTWALVLGEMPTSDKHKVADTLAYTQAFKGIAGRFKFLEAAVHIIEVKDIDHAGDSPGWSV